MAVWSVPAVVVRVIDGDTVALVLDLGWRVSMAANVRIIGVNAPEVSEQSGRDARAWAADMLPAGMAVTFVSRQLDKYGRPLGDILMPPGARSYAAALLAAGHAEPLTY